MLKNYYQIHIPWYSVYMILELFMYLFQNTRTDLFLSFLHKWLGFSINCDYEVVKIKKKI